MLEVLLGCLLDVLQRGVTAKGVVHGDSPDMAGRLYLRIAGHLQQVLMHPLVALELMGPQAGTEVAALFWALRLAALRPSLQLLCCGHILAWTATGHALAGHTAKQASLLASPYVDSHGEEDLRLQRGKPLFLHAAREQHLLQLWRLDGFDFDSHVLHSANHHNELTSVY